MITKKQASIIFQKNVFKRVSKQIADASKEGYLETWLGKRDYPVVKEALKKAGFKLKATERAGEFKVVLHD